MCFSEQKTNQGVHTAPSCPAAGCWLCLNTCRVQFPPDCGSNGNRRFLDRQLSGSMFFDIKENAGAHDAMLARSRRYQLLRTMLRKIFLHEQSARSDRWLLDHNLPRWSGVGVHGGFVALGHCRALDRPFETFRARSLHNRVKQEDWPANSTSSANLATDTSASTSDKTRKSMMM